MLRVGGNFRGLVMVGLIILSVMVYTPQMARAVYPEKPIEFVVPFGVGGGSDILARNIVKVIEQERLLPQPVMVVNKPGGGGALGYSYLAGKKGDPYYIGTVSSSFWTVPLLGQSPVGYKDFTPIVGLCSDANVLLVRQDSPYKRVEEIIKVAKEKPKGISVGGTGPASDDRVLTRLLEKAAGIELNYVPFKGGGDVLIAVLGGHVEIAWANPAEALAQLEAKKARPLAISSDERLKTLPDVPTFKELGINAVMYMLRGVVGPKDIPKEAVKVLEEVLMKMAQSEIWIKGYIERNMLIPRFQGADDFAKAIEAQNEVYREIFKELGLLK